MQEHKEFLTGTIARWPNPDYGFATALLEGERITVFIHRRTLCEHLLGLDHSSSRASIHFYLQKVEKGWNSTRTVCKECYERAAQRRRQRAALLEARSLLHGLRFEFPGLPTQCFLKELIRFYPAFQAAERAAAGRILARSSRDEILAAARSEMHRVLSQPAATRKAA